MIIFLPNKPEDGKRKFPNGIFTATRPGIKVSLRLMGPYEASTLLFDVAL